MSQPELPAEFPFPDYEGIVLEDDEVTDFCRRNIWPAAIYFWGTGFRDPKNMAENEQVYAGFESPDGDNYVSLSCYINDDADRDLDQTIVDIPPEPVVCIEMEVMREEVMAMVPKACRGTKVWHTLCFCFPVDGSEPWVESHYSLESPQGKDIDHLNGAQKEFLEALEDSERFRVDRDEELTSQDLIDVYNILLTVGVDESILDLHGSES